jgi:hypothetical protein
MEAQGAVMGGMSSMAAGAAGRMYAAGTRVQAPSKGGAVVGPKTRPNYGRQGEAYLSPRERNILQEENIMLAGYGSKGVGGDYFRARGHIPNFNRKSVASETIGALTGGYMPGKIEKMQMPGLGTVTYNSLIHLNSLKQEKNTNREL